jgi:excisionase family DNA binding protein
VSMSKKSFSISDLWRLSAIAHATGIPRTTLRAAVERGEIPYWTTACGTALVRQQDVRDWATRGPDRLGWGKPRTWDLPSS